MKYFVVLLVLITSFLSINLAYGLWLPQTPQELLEESQVVFVGTIASVNVLEFEESSTSYVEEDGIDKPLTENYILSLDEYSVNVEEFLKNPQNSTVLKVRQPTISIPGKIIPQGGFEVGGRVLFYIEEFDGTNTYSKESFLIPGQCDASSVIHEPRMVGGDVRMMQNGIEKKDNFTANSPIQFIAERDMDTLSGASMSYDAYISKQVGKTYKERVFNQTIIADSKQCQWLSVATWEFTPDSGNYLLNGRVYEAKSSSGIGNTFFSVWPEPPLKQFKSGISASDITCRDGLILQIKNWKGTPVCVKGSSIEKLAQRDYIYHPFGSSGEEIVDPNKLNDHLRQDLLNQLRITPRIESMYNFTDSACDFVISEILKDKQVRDLIKDYQYKTSNCSFGMDKSEPLLNRYVAITLDVVEKQFSVTVTYDLQQEKITYVLGPQSEFSN